MAVWFNIVVDDDSEYAMVQVGVCVCLSMPLKIADGDR